jgi:hypothetical protein
LIETSVLEDGAVVKTNAAPTMIPRMTRTSPSRRGSMRRHGAAAPRTRCCTRGALNAWRFDPRPCSRCKRRRRRSHRTRAAVTGPSRAPSRSPPRCSCPTPCSGSPRSRPRRCRRCLWRGTSRGVNGSGRQRRRRSTR